MSQLNKGTLYVRDPDGTCIVLADGVDVTYACDIEGCEVSLPANLPAGCTISLPSGFHLANALHRETARQRKNREAAASAMRAQARAAQGQEQGVAQEEVSAYAGRYALTIMTYSIWAALYGKDNTPPFPISAGPMPEEAVCL